jgi:uncharacterized glyoxalase superfamily protein PhnB
MNVKAIPMIHVPDVRATAEWYESVGFKLIDAEEDEGEMTWASLSVGSSEIMLNAGGRASDAERRDVDLYVYSEDVAALYERLEGAVYIIAPINDTFYGNREFTIRDPNGFWLTFGQPIPVAGQ